MLSTNYRATSALMNTRYSLPKDHELATALKQARRATSPVNADIPPVPAATARPSRLRILLGRFGVASA